ncbi:hypothetical protein LOC67_17195 [Stieleria sp. JC731]|uniref:hypothetical protein n=1 Tax=Pirellulaceae TaxID=2691357 RepID=UPI001E4DEDDA|nr:hypothetical protein [Stieleria sp. JC731]MCC9602293.1 hypothetical protein [Stieleria sp. JC731]
MSILDEIAHPFWGRVIRVEGYEGWHCPIEERLSDGTLVSIRVEFDDPDNEIVQQNYTAIRERWDQIWVRIQERIGEMKAAYGYGGIPIQAESDWFELKPPVDSIDEGAEWSVMLQDDEAGWLIDFAGWGDDGGQGVF